jgi:hypothetical protein
VFFASSAYKGTPEAKNAAKKPHKMKKSAEKSADFNLIKGKTIKPYPF